jgi:hypothetical protein
VLGGAAVTRRRYDELSALAGRIVNERWRRLGDDTPAGVEFEKRSLPLLRRVENLLNLAIVYGFDDEKAA